MYKKVNNEFVLNDRDQMVLIFDKGTLKVLINNDLKMTPDNISIQTESYGTVSMINDKPKKIISRLILNVEEENE
ncbi:hypothetical protein KEC48_03345 [Clostridium sp. C1]|uniref:hypothetical protein n=1 Tax=Clostridium sp. C1 TaxID=1155388 RepID=UPI001BAC868D|nr:hypothetical protein [Clostridium sp. C1]QUN13574.1 hypothetical protein KEC48_03345 [Clostridium sp. C1]